MVDSSHIYLRAHDRSFYALLKKDVHRFCVDNKINESRINNIDIIVSELTSNLQKHAIGGAFLVKCGYLGTRKFIEIVCQDDGPGIPDISRVMKDGYSSVNTMGHGLGSVRRLSDFFDIFSLKGWGTIIAARVFNEPERVFKKQHVAFRGLNIPKTGETVSGDGYFYQEIPKGFRMLIADGLGHGPDAYEAVQSAIRFFSRAESDSPATLLRTMHTEIRKTRGCVAAIILYDRERGEWKYGGIGNISLKWLGEDSKNASSYNGIIGHNIPTTINDTVLKASEYPLMIACSDGIRSSWNLNKFPQILKNDGTVIATAVAKEFSRNTDDTSVVVCKL